MKCFFIFRVSVQILSLFLYFIAPHLSFAAGVEDLLVDASDYIASRLIPAAAVGGTMVGSVMWGLGSPKGIEIIKWSIGGGIVGTAGAETLRTVFF